MVSLCSKRLYAHSLQRKSQSAVYGNSTHINSRLERYCSASARWAWVIASDPAPRRRSPPGTCHSTSGFRPAAPACECQCGPSRDRRCVFGSASRWSKNRYTAGSGPQNSHTGRREVQYKGKYSVIKWMGVY